MKPISRLNLFLLVGFAALTLASCGRQDRGVKDGKPVVMVSIAPQEWLLRQIVGDKMEIRTFLSGAANPESFDPPMSSIMALNDCAAYMRMGHLGFEDTILDKLGDTGLNVIDTSAGIVPLEGTHGHAHDNGCSGHEVDPHTWSSVKNARIIARNMLDAAVRTDPANSEYYTRRYRLLDSTLDSLDRSISERLAPLAGQSFLVWHPSLSYFARDYGLNQISIGAENKELSLRSLQAKIDEARSHGRMVLFVQPEFDDSKSRAVFGETDTRRVAINPLDPDWMGQIEMVTDALTSNSRPEK